MNEVMVIFGIIAFITVIVYRKWIAEYVRQYGGEMKKAWKGESKEPSHLEYLSFDWKRIYMVAVTAVHTVLWFFVPWWFTISSFVIFYFVGGLILMTYVWNEE